MPDYRKLLRGVGQKTRDLYGSLAEEATEEGDELLRSQAGGYFDLSRAMENPGILADTGLERYQPTRMPASLERGGDATRSRRLMDTTLEGMRQGAHGWYNTEPLYNEFTKILGPEQGAQDFRRYMDIVAATSPRSKVETNIKRASIPYMRERQGLPIAGMTNPASKINPNPGPMEMRYPPGYGHLAQNLHQANLDELAERGALDPATKPKVSSFAENLKGNYAPMTMDTHNRAAVFPEDIGVNKEGQKLMKSPSKTEYGILEDYQAELGRMLGLSPAQWQSSLWTGGAANTGVHDARNFMNLFNESIKRTADKHNITEREASEAFIKGEIPLAKQMGQLWEVYA